MNKPYQISKEVEVEVIGVNEAPNLHDQDFYAWTREQVKFLKDKTFDKLDLIHLVELVESNGNSYAHNIVGNLEDLLMNLLRWRYQLKAGSREVRKIDVQRTRLAQHIKNMPSLKNVLLERLLNSYQLAISWAVLENGLDNSYFPATCEWTLDQILDSNFYPN